MLNVKMFRSRVKQTVVESATYFQRDKNRWPANLIFDFSEATEYDEVKIEKKSLEICSRLSLRSVLFTVCWK